MNNFWIAALILAAVATPARADDADVLRRLIQESGAAVAVPAPAPTSDDSLRLSPDSSTVVHLEEDAASVVVANPAHAAVVLDSPRLLIVMPRAPGVTSFTVLSAAGKTIMERKVIVSGVAKQKYIRVRRACGAGDATCVPNAYYYCPDGCYEVTPVTGEAQGTTPPAPAISGGGSNSVVVEEDPAPPVPEIVNGEPQRPATP